MLRPLMALIVLTLGVACAGEPAPAGSAESELSFRRATYVSDAGTEPARTLERGTIAARPVTTRPSPTDLAAPDPGETTNEDCLGIGNCAAPHLAPNGSSSFVFFLRASPFARTRR